MENAPTSLIGPPPPFPFSAPPGPVGQITILTAPPPPSFPDTSSSFDLSPLEFLLALVAIITVPALIYTFIFAVKCPSRRRQSDEASTAPSVVSEPSHDGDAVSVSDLKYQKDAHGKEINSECPVCLSVFGDGEEVRQLSVCKHSFHASCIDEWLSNQSNCPICRATIAVKRPNTAARARHNDLQQGRARDNDLRQGLPDASSLV